MTVGKSRKKRKDKAHHWSDACTPNCDCDIPGCDCFSLSMMLRLFAALSRTPGGSRAERAVTGAIRGYRKVSPRLPTRCRYQPTCSAYALLAIERHGLRAGLRLTAARLARCRPGVPFGTGDPVP
ncbi:membrane protein insertion efficiency factor YidD [Actinoplanes sp. NPDC026670]|uniref:membrane protein insertion efficiency factor YidD n=1 Tax=Actinoplanes sp. NPDC026670 TaxID=3154700 RepID=UPI003411D9C6